MEFFSNGPELIFTLELDELWHAEEDQVDEVDKIIKVDNDTWYQQFVSPVCHVYVCHYYLTHKKNNSPTQNSSQASARAGRKIITRVSHEVEGA